jgi:predicted PhzF superfamily epimerase YddE/YHI9
MMPIRYFVVDAFTDRPFAGNPAAVVMLDHWRAPPLRRIVGKKLSFFLNTKSGF